MKWQIRQVGIEHSRPLAGHAQRKVVEPLARMTGSVRRVLVRLKSGDRDRARGGCGAAVLVTLSDGGTVHVDAWSDNHYAAIEDVSDRVRHVVSQRIERSRDRRRRSGRRRAA